MTRLSGTLKLALAILREIFDEASYARFLQRANAPSSPDAYAAYWREREASQARKPRCC
jgi:hypothetical protein